MDNTKKKKVTDNFKEVELWEDHSKDGKTSGGGLLIVAKHRRMAET
jgi:hypothetical protein